MKRGLSAARADGADTELDKAIALLQGELFVQRKTREELASASASLETLRGRAASMLPGALSPHLRAALDVISDSVDATRATSGKQMAEAFETLSRSIKHSIARIRAGTLLQDESTRVKAADELREIEAKFARALVESGSERTDGSDESQTRTASGAECSTERCVSMLESVRSLADRLRVTLSAHGYSSPFPRDYSLAPGSV
jgi:hypothetical protein